MLLYVHVPFCRSKCAYCAFHSAPYSGPAAVSAYLDTLVAELARRAEEFGGRTLESVYFGGGTPTLLPTAVLARLLERVTKVFSLAPNAEISLEANPESVPDARAVRQLLTAGFNRVSLGVQSFSDKSLRRLGRAHVAADAVRAVSRLREGGFRNVGLDLMWGLPGQRPWEWMEELKQAVALEPEHLSCYGLTLEPGTPLARAPLSPEGDDGLPPLPSENDQARMYVNGIEYLASHGYMQYEISNLARMGFACRHSLGYWEGSDYIGLGPSAVSTVDGLRWANSEDHETWNNEARHAGLAPTQERIDGNTRLLETIMLRLRTARGLPFDLYKQMTGRDFLQDHGPLVRALAREKLLALRNRHARLTVTGMLVSNSIVEALFERVESLPGNGLKATEP